MLASELYAMSQGSVCSGPYLCYWCGGPCTERYIHGERPWPIGQKYDQTVSFRQSPYYCAGCWLWQRPRLTAWFIDGETFKDGQCPGRLSWWFTEWSCQAVEPKHGPIVYPLLLKPPLRFTLSIVASGQPNYLQLAKANDNQQVLANTPLHFTVNGTAFTYTVGDLKQALKTGDANGYDAGVHQLIGLFGPYKVPEEPEEKKRGRGRPPLGEEVTSRAVREASSVVRGYSGSASVGRSAQDPQATRNS